MPGPEPKPEPSNTHYFTSSPTTPQKLRKLFESVRSQTLSLQTSSGVFSPDSLDKGTRILIEGLMIPPASSEMNLLEIGAGYGPLVIWLAKEYALQHQIDSNSPLPNIYASEINERAVWLLKRNLVANNCKEINILKGDFRTHLQELEKQQIRFQAIYTNPPLKLGHDLMLELFEGAMQLLTPTGYIQYVHKKKLGAPGFLKKLQTLRPDWFFKIVKKKAGYHVIVLSPVDFEVEDTSQGYGGYF